MRVVFNDGVLDHDVDLAVADLDARLADAVTALAGPESPPSTVWIDGQPAPVDIPLSDAGLLDGTRVSVVPELPAAGSSVGGMWSLVEMAGLASGRRHDLGIGRSTIGRSAERAGLTIADRSLAPVHAVVEVAMDNRVRIGPDGDAPVVVDGLAVADMTELREGSMVELGQMRLRLAARPRDDRAVAMKLAAEGSLTSVVPFNRPPRTGAHVEERQLDLPKPPNRDADKPPFNPLMVALPAVLGLGMYLVSRSIMMLMFMIGSPLMQLGNVMENRRRSKHSIRKDNRRFALELERLVTDLDELATEEAERRERAAPPLPEVVRRAALPSVHLWERRTFHDDFLAVRLGVGVIPWEPPVKGDRRMPEVAAALDRHRRLERSVLVGSLRPPEHHGGRSSKGPDPFAPGGAVGLAGHRPTSLALARSLIVQAAVHQGPVDVQIAAFVSPDRAADWDWLKWLPHTLDPEGRAQLVAVGDEAANELAGALLRSRAEVPDKELPAGQVLWVIVDDPQLLAGRRAPVRRLLGQLGWVTGLVIAEQVEQLPAMCVTVVDAGTNDAAFTEPGRVRVFYPGAATDADVVVAGLDDRQALATARRLARFEDPELHLAGAGLPDVIRLPGLLGLDLDTYGGADLLRAWTGRRWDGRGLEGPLGASEDGVFLLDLVRDGPHGLIGGTTGSGKSELMRSLVAGLAIRYSPDEVNLILGDYKGGGAFDIVNDLPHCVGYFDDLDAASAERVLRSLEAELQKREQWYKDAHVDSFDAYRKVGGPMPLPRLVVIIDEYAKMAEELPDDFLDTLIGVAERGRSLGVHLLLAAQRPSQAINDRIRANTNLRIALRVQSKGDSEDVIESPAAASIGRRQSGRAYVRLGQDELVPIQSAWSTAPRNSDAAMAAVEAAPFGLTGVGPALAQATSGSAAPPTAEAPPGDGSDGSDGPGTSPAAAVAAAVAPAGGGTDPHATDLHALVALSTDAYERGIAAGVLRKPRIPMQPPLPSDLGLSQLPGTEDLPAGVLPLMLADDPDQQTQYPLGWAPSVGNLIVYGIPGSGVSTSLRAIAAGLAGSRSADDLHLYAIDYDGGSMQPLVDLPHTGAVVAAGEAERLSGLLRLLGNELTRRRAPGHDHSDDPRWVVLVDGYGSIAEELRNGTLAEQRLLDLLTRVFTDGPAVGISTVLGASRAGAVTMSLASLVRQRLILRLSGRDDYSYLMGSVKSLPNFHPGGGYWAETRQVVQVAHADTDLLGRAVANTPTSRPPRQVRKLPTDVGRDVLAAAVVNSSGPWFIPFGIGSRDLEPAGLEVFPAEHVFITGPPRSGKSTALMLVADTLDTARVPYVVVASNRSPFHGASGGLGTFGPTDLETALVKLPTGGPCALIVDDCEGVADSGNKLTDLLLDRSLALRAFVAGSPDRLRRDSLHWSRNVRMSRTGLLLNPSENDAILFEVQIPKNNPVPVNQTRGWIVQNGVVGQVVQLADPNRPTTEPGR
jgi:S-DNA-T family DNA segregation ATPase FtsK/SpoIIIE